MERTSVQKLARILRVLVVLVFVCNLLALLLVPGITFAYEDPQYVMETFRLDTVIFGSWLWLWALDVYHGFLAVFLWVCGICTALILWQAKKVLDNLAAGELFSGSNAGCLRRAAIFSLVIAAASLLWAVCRAVLRGPYELASLSTLFFPVFFLAGLLFLVMSALFRQAAELKAENDLTI